MADIQAVLSMFGISFVDIEDPENCCELDQRFGFDTRKTLENIEADLDGLVLEVVIQLREPTSNEVTENSFKYMLTNNDEPEEMMALDNNGQGDDMNQFLDRLELLQKNCTKLLNEISEIVEEVEQQYRKEDYKIMIVKHKMNSDGVSETSSEFEGFYNKRKFSFDTDSDMENPCQRQCIFDYPILVDPFSDMLQIGPNGTKIHRLQYEALQWIDPAGTTRELCSILFGDEILATHSLTGNQSPAFRGRERPLKAQLDSQKTADITYVVCSKFNVSQQFVRGTITTKCADAAKKIKRLIEKAVNFDSNLY